MVFQDPMTSLNPVVPIGVQVTEVLRRHTDLDREAARVEAEQLLRRVGIPDPNRRLKEYPHQLSGGMRQRALIAMSLACKPRLLICDEPTTALDVTIQAQVLELLKQLVRETGTAMIMITHDLGVVAGICDEVNVMYAGRVVERAGRRELFACAAPPVHRRAAALDPAPRRRQGRAADADPGVGLRHAALGRGAAPSRLAARPGSRTASCPTCELTHDDERPDHRLRCVHPVPPGGGDA